MNSENKNLNLDNIINNKVESLATETEFATVTQLNVEANVRASNDQTIQDNFNLKLNEIDNKITNLEENIIQSKIMAQDDQQNELDYATIKELNVEASVRASNDQIISDRYDFQIGEINNKFIEEEEKIDNLEGKVTMTEDDVKIHDERITALEGGIWDQIRRLEEELEEANAIIKEKDEELKKLKEGPENSGSNYIDLKFSIPPEYTVTEIMSVKKFINNNLKDLIIPKMDILYPGTTFGRDYTIVINGLAYGDIMQGKMIPICVKSIKKGKLIGESNFDIKVTYNYSIEQQKRFVEEFFQPAIPVSLRNLPENKAANYNVPAEIAKTRPLKLLLNNRDYKYFAFKIFAEMNSASYWTNFHRIYQQNLTGYVGTGQSNIGGTTKDKIINNINSLYDSTSGYHNSIYRFLERLINDSGVRCTITKSWGNSTTGKALHHVGNLVFDVPNSNLDDTEVVITQARAYYMMINFEININSEVKKLYRGVTLALTDNLELYPTIFA